MADSKVLPYEKIPAQVISLSVRDTTAPKLWVTQLLFWPLQDPAKFKQCYENLKEALARLLTEIPALVGDLTSGSKDDVRHLNIAIRDGATVNFTFDDVAAMQAVPSYDELRRTGFPITDLKEPLSPKVALDPVIEGSPMFCGKLNLIKGGVILMFGFNHVLTDGWTASELERLWAMHAVDVSTGVAFRKHKAATPDDEIRKRYGDPIALDTTSELDSFLQIVPAEDALMHLHKDLAAAKAVMQKTVGRILSHLGSTGDLPEARSTTIFRFTPEKLAKLKEAAASPNADMEDWISTMDALAGLFWSRVAHIQCLSAKGKDTSICLFLINVRQRLQPPIPEGYVGNAVSPISASCSLAQLESDSEGLKTAALSMRQANKGWSQSRWEAWMNKIITLPPDQAVALKRDVLLGAQNLGFNDYSRFQSNLTDWGAPLGQVARTRYFRPPLPGGMLWVLVHPRLADGALEVSLGCSDAVRKGLLDDAVFKQYGELVCTSEEQLVSAWMMRGARLFVRASSLKKRWWG